MLSSTWPDYRAAAVQFLVFVVLPTALAAVAGGRRSGAATVIGFVAGLFTCFLLVCLGARHLTSVWLFYAGMAGCWSAAFVVARWASR